MPHNVALAIAEVCLISAGIGAILVAGIVIGAVWMMGHCENFYCWWKQPRWGIIARVRRWWKGARDD